MSDAEMDRYLEQVRAIEEAETKSAPWRDSPFYRPLSFTALLPPCGCRIEGDGNLPSPLRIKFCARHEPEAKP